MKRHDDNLRDVFDRLMPDAPMGALEDAAGRVQRRLREGRRHEATREPPAVSRARIGLRFAVAAALIMTVAIGVYAYRVQRESSPIVALPVAQSSAPSEKAAAETAQVAAVTSEPTKSEVSPSREEILAGVAAQIAAVQATDAGGARPKFAAASVRPVPVSPLISNGFKCLGVDGLLGQPPSRQDPTARQGRCAGQVVHITDLVYPAYTSSSLFIPSPLYAIDPPGVLNGSYFAIEAVADNPERVTKGELKMMLQTLLEDRFKARVHLETRASDGYVLTIAKSGIKFKETSGDPTCNSSPRPLGVNGKCKIATLAMRLQLTLDGRTSFLDYVPIADKTGLAGIYDINFALEEIPFGTAAGTRGPGGGAPQARQFTTAIPKALEDQLGLHLERGKVPVEFVVVDHIEPPTEN